MFTLTVLALAVSAILIVASIALMRKLAETEAELERAHERMARLDRLVEEYTTRDEELAETTERPRERVDSAQLVAAVGLAADTDEVFDEEFAAPRMAAAVEDPDEIPVMQTRSRLDTPVATPRNTLPPGAEASVLEVGSIQVRSEALKSD